MHLHCGERVEELRATVQVVYRSGATVGPLSLEARVGELTCLLGPNGSGKSTVLRAVLGLLPGATVELGACKFSRGLGELAGFSQAEPPLTVEARVDEYLAASLSPLTVVGGSAERLCSFMLATVGLPCKLCTSRLSELSSGERRLIQLLYAIARRTPVLLVDEPDAHLDLRFRLRVFKLLRRAARRRIVVAATHDLTVGLRFCDYVYMLRSGRVEARGSPWSVARREVIRRVYGVEAEVIEVRGLPAVVPLDDLPDCLP